MSDARLLVGQVLGGRYRLTGILGQGGVGTVYDAVQEDLGRKVAVKVLGHIDSFMVVGDGGGVMQSECVEHKLRATTAPGVCNMQAPPGCTVWVDLEGRYRDR